MSLLIMAACARKNHSGGSDPFWTNVVSLLHFEGANGSTTFTDQKGIIYTPTGTAAISTSQFKFGTSSGNFPSGANRLTAPAISGGMSGDFTIECFIYPTASGVCGIIRWDTNNRSIYLNSSSQLSWYNGNSYYMPSTTLTLNTWYHIAAVRASNNMSLFLNGVRNPGVFSDTTNLSTTYSVGGDAFSQPLKGFMDEFRLTNGVARYTSNFTPPIAPFPNQ